MRYSEEQYNQKYRSLSQKTQDFMGSEDVDGALADIARNFNLSPEKRKIMAGEIAYVLIGLEQKNNFVGNLKQYVGIDEMVAQKIAKDVEEWIFTPAEELNLPMVIPAQRQPVQIVQPVATVIKKEIPPSFLPPLTPKPSINRIPPPEVKNVGFQIPPNLPVAPMSVQTPKPVQPTLQQTIAPTFVTSKSPLEGSTASPRAGGMSSSAAPTPKPPQPPRTSGNEFFVSRPQSPQFRPTQQRPVSPMQSASKAESIVDARLGGSFNLPHEEVSMTAPKPDQTSSGKKVDPYREPIE